MILNLDLYCPTIKRKVHIQISIPKGYKEDHITKYDCLYMLDGQNIFKDHVSAFGRSLRMGKYLAIMARKFKKRICGIAISNAGSDLGRVNEYTPFKLESIAYDEWHKQDVSVCEKFTYDFIHTIIPYINTHINTSGNNFIMGSSLGALYAAYVANTYKDYFNGCGLFSICTFLCDNAFYKHIETNYNQNCRNFLYVGLEETSDGSFDKDLYFNSSLNLHNFNKSHNIKSHLCVDPFGIHNEETWERHILEFLSYMYYDDLTICW